MIVSLISCVVNFFFAWDRQNVLKMQATFTMERRWKLWSVGLRTVGPRTRTETRGKLKGAYELK